MVREKVLPESRWQGLDWRGKEVNSAFVEWVAGQIVSMVDSYDLSGLLLAATEKPKKDYKNAPHNLGHIDLNEYDLVNIPWKTSSDSAKVEVSIPVLFTEESIHTDHPIGLSVIFQAVKMMSGKTIHHELTISPLLETLTAVPTTSNDEVSSGRSILEPEPVREGVGVGPIVIGQSTVDDVIAHLGQPMEKTSRRGVEYYNYGDQGLMIAMDRDTTQIVRSIEISPPNRGETTRGITAGANTAADTVKAYGPPNWYTLDSSRNWFISYPGVDFEIEGIQSGKQFPLNKEAILFNKVVKISLSGIDRHDLFPQESRLPDWQQAGLWGSFGGSNNGNVTEFNHGAASSTTYVYSGADETECQLEIREFPNAELAVRLGKVHVEEHLENLPDWEKPYEQVNLKGRFGEHAIGVIRDNTNKRWAEIFCYIDRFYIGIYDDGNGGDTQKMFERFAELYDYIKEQVYFYDHLRSGNAD